jgi:1,4-dihydroxy-2-naphthoate octaprenyltransferase
MIKHIEKANNIIRSKGMQTFDWIASAAFLVAGAVMIFLYGLTLNACLTLGCGVVGLILAKVRPAVRLQDYLEKRMINRIKTK